MTRFVNEHMTLDEQVDYAWNNRELFAACREHNLRVIRARYTLQVGRYIRGWEVDARELLIKHADDLREGLTHV